MTTQTERRREDVNFALACEAYWSTLARRIATMPHRYKKYQADLDALHQDASNNAKVWYAKCQQINQREITPQAIDARSRASYQAAKDADRARASKSPYRELDSEYTQA